MVNTNSRAYAVGKVLSSHAPPLDHQTRVAMATTSRSMSTIFSNPNRSMNLLFGRDLQRFISDLDKMREAVTLNESTRKMSYNDNAVHMIFKDLELRLQVASDNSPLKINITLSRYKCLCYITIDCAPEDVKACIEVVTSLMLAVHDVTLANFKVINLMRVPAIGLMLPEHTDPKTVVANIAKAMERCKRLFHTAAPIFIEGASKLVYAPLLDRLSDDGYGKSLARFLCAISFAKDHFNQSLSIEEESTLGTTKFQTVARRHVLIAIECDNKYSMELIKLNTPYAGVVRCRMEVKIRDMDVVEDVKELMETLNAFGGFPYQKLVIRTLVILYPHQDTNDATTEEFCEVTRRCEMLFSDTREVEVLDGFVDHEGVPILKMHAQQSHAKPVANSAPQQRSYMTPQGLHRAHFKAMNTKNAYARRSQLERT